MENINTITSSEDSKSIINKEEIIKSFIESHCDEPVQGSSEWKLTRNSIIGGSEISTIMGLNPFNNISQLVAQKVNLDSFNGSSATRWGNLFENVSELLFKIMFDTVIYNTGSIQNKIIQNHRYSPDGICLVNFINENSTEDDVEQKITLLEFKSPYGTIPNDKVPKHYVPQIKAGMCTIDIAENALFINNMFRKCLLKDLNFDLNYDFQYHNKDDSKKMKGITTTIANGMVFISIPLDHLNLFDMKYNEFIKSKYRQYFQDEVSEHSDDEILDSSNKVSNDFICNFLIDNGTDSDYEFDPEDINLLDDNTHILFKIKAVIQRYNTINSNKNELTKKMYIASLAKELIDFGGVNKLLFDQFLELYKLDDESSCLKTTFIKPQINPDALNDKHVNLIIPNSLKYVKSAHYRNKICKSYDLDKLINKFITNCMANESIPIGFLPWKLLRSSIISVEKEDNFLDNIKEKIDNTMEIVQDILENSSSPDEIADNFDKHFENNRITKKYHENKPKTFEYYKDFML